jgi:hypothetical protein
VIESGELYGLMGEFDDPERLTAAVRQVQAAGYRRFDAHTPYRVEALDEALDTGVDWVPWITLAGGIAGCVGAFLLQWWVSAVYYPINVGGRPVNSWPMWVPIMFEVTVLGASLFATFGMLALNGLPMPYHPVFNVPIFSRTTQDRFFLVLEADDPRFDRFHSRRLLEELGAREVVDVPR